MGPRDDPSCVTGPGKRRALFIIDGKISEPRQRRVDRGLTHHTPCDHDQSANHRAYDQDDGQENDGWQYGMRRRGSRRILLQVPTEDDELAADPGVAGERQVAAEDENIAIDRTVKKNIPGEGAHATAAAPFDGDGAQVAGDGSEGLLWPYGNIAANPYKIWRQGRQKHDAKNETPWKHAIGFLGELG
jgi:hypothetical protein